MDDLLGELALANQTRVPVNPKGEELEALREALEAEAAKKAAKRQKRRQGGKATTDETETPLEVELVSGTGIKSSAKREWNGCDDLSNEQPTRRRNVFAADHAPEGADEAVTRRPRVQTRRRRERDVLIQKRAEGVETHARTERWRLDGGRALE